VSKLPYFVGQCLVDIGVNFVQVFLCEFDSDLVLIKFLDGFL
jgi:hypothetical protein